ncbi:MAG: CBS domain-containing protein, partial [Nitrospinales bacterium]
GADLKVVANFVQPRLNPEQVDVMNQLIRNLENFNINGVEVSLATATVDYYIDDLALVVQKIVDMENLVAFFALICLEQRIYLIARSRADEVNVAEILQIFGGGGHPSAASASIREMTLIQVREKLIAVLNEKILPLNLVADVMHFPVVSVKATDPIDKVEQKLTRFNLNTLPVLEGKRPVGLITRQIVEKAIYHKMRKEPTEDFMIREFSVTTPDSFFKTLIPIIIEEKQKLIPVVEGADDHLVGIVSRGDLLRMLYGDMVSGSEKSRTLLAEGGHVPLKNVKSLMKERLPKEIMSLFNVIAQEADAAGISVFVVGGFVRDLLLSIQNLDIDIVVEGDGISFARKLAKKLGGRVKSHAKFGTSVIVREDGFKLDVATARMEFYKHPAALPTVEMSSIKSDLFRRDFTFNALAIKLNGKDAFSLMDFFNGQRDLKDKVVRVLHNLSFIEDPSRAFRAVRFEQRFGFRIGRQTEAFIKNAVRKKLIDRLSGHRLLNELVQILKEKNPLNCVDRMKELQLLQFIHPDLGEKTDHRDLMQKVEKVLSWSEMVSLTKSPEVWFVYFLALLYPLDEEAFEEVPNRLHIPMKMQERLRADREGYRNTLKLLGRENDFSPSEIYDIFSRLSPEAILFVLALSGEERAHKYALLYFTQYRSAANLSLTGDDLIAMGISPGPVFKAVFKALRDARLNGHIKTRAEEKALVEREFLNPQKT